MRAIAERFARRWWAGELGAMGNALDLLAAPASWAWSSAQRARAKAAARRPPIRIEGVRVISVGNLAVGGTGKTPLVARVARDARCRGARVAVVVGGAASDEAALHRRWNPDVPVLASRERPTSIRQACEGGADVVILDDAFHRVDLARDVDLVLLSADDPFPGPVLPRGPYREPPSALARADGIVVTRREAARQKADALIAALEERMRGRVIGSVHLAPGSWTTLDGRPAGPPASDARSGVLAVCAIARPESFAAAVRATTGADVELLGFADHHAFTTSDAARIERKAAGRPIVATEKDAAKLAAWADLLPGALVLRDELRWDFGEDALGARIASVLGAAR